MAESRAPGRHWMLVLMTCAVAGTASAAELTIDRLFDAPALSGPTVLDMKVSPDGSRVTYLQGKTDRKDRLDLWEYNINDAASRILVDSDSLTADHANLSDEELSRRERQRIAALSGIVEYSLAPSGSAV